MWLQASGYAHVQLVGMSATLPNIKTFCRWMKADLYSTDHRPVAIHSSVTVNGTTFNAEREIVRHEPVKREGSWRGDVLQARCQEAVQQGSSVLVFVNTRKSAQVRWPRSRSAAGQCGLACLLAA